MADDTSTPGDPFTFQLAHGSCLARAALVAARPILSRALGLDDLREIYDRAASMPGRTFVARALAALDVRYRIDRSPQVVIPAQGPLIVAANHPTGAVDGLVLADALGQVRPDVRLMANHVLGRFPELADLCFFVDPFGGPTSASRSQPGLRSAHLWLRGGGALIMFPAGEVAWQPAGTESAIRPDSPWHATLGRLALATRAQVIPAFVDGGNPPAFYAAGRLHPRLRTLLLGRALLAARGRTARIVMGAAIGQSPRQTPGVSAAEAFTQDVRTAVDRLAVEVRPARPAPIEAAVAPDALMQDIATFPAGHLLLRSGPFDVFCAGAESIPHVLREIGRLRELTFREAGEGTGMPVDLDEFDAHYQHLFVWHRVRQEVVGAYRLGPTDTIAPRLGSAGLYTSTLFRYDDRFLSRLGPALELGRSFVRASYQRSYSPLLLLWKGIGQVIVRSPRYRILFGAVSISSRYTDTSQQLLRAFLTQERGSETFAALVEPVNPPAPLQAPARAAVAAADISTVDLLIRRLERTQGIPVLLRQYLQLNATLLGFNVDPAFGDALDALMMVDLARVPVATLRRYMGPDADALFRASTTRAA